MLSKIKPLHLIIVGCVLILIAYFWMQKNQTPEPEVIEFDEEPVDTTIRQPKKRVKPEPEPEPAPEPQPEEKTNETE